MAAVLGVSIGTIQAAPPSLNTGVDVQKPQTIQVNSVKVENFAGHVQIKSEGSGQDVTVQMVADPSILEQVLVKEINGSLNISFAHSAPIQKNPDRLKLFITMPAQMPLNLTLAGGKGEIGPREADTSANLDGYGDIKLDSVKNFKSEIRGSGEITVNNIEGTTDIAIRGDGKYLIQKGSISDLKAIIQGTGEVEVQANVRNADLRTDGAGKIQLPQVTGDVKQEINGSGTITIGKAH
jgi:hypothetical protein